MPSPEGSEGENAAELLEPPGCSHLLGVTQLLKRSKKSQTSALMSPRDLGLAGGLGPRTAGHAATAPNTQSTQESLSDLPVPQTPQPSGLPLSTDLKPVHICNQSLGELLSPYRTLQAGSLHNPAGVEAPMDV